MKLIILHGDNQVESRRRLSQLISQAKKKGLEIQRLDGKGLVKSDLLMAARSQSLLSDDHLVVVEDFFANNKKAAEAAQEVTKTGGAEFVFWEKSALSPTTVKKLLKIAGVEEFKIPKSIFKFLDSLAPGNTKAMLNLLHNVRESEEEFVFFMLGRQIRLLIWAKKEPETLALPEWQKTKLIKQAEKFSPDCLLLLHHRLLELDRANKKSQLPENLSASLDLLLVGL